VGVVYNDLRLIEAQPPTRNTNYICMSNYVSLYNGINIIIHTRIHTDKGGGRTQLTAHPPHHHPPLGPGLF